MAKTIQKTLVQMVVDYSDAVGRLGTENERVTQLRKKYSVNREFVGYAEAVDRLKEEFAGKTRKFARVEHPVG